MCACTCLSVCMHARVRVAFCEGESGHRVLVHVVQYQLLGVRSDPVFLWVFSVLISFV